MIKVIGIIAVFYLWSGYEYAKDYYDIEIAHGRKPNTLKVLKELVSWPWSLTK